MTGPEFEALFKAFGLPGVAVAAFFWLAVKKDFFKEDPRRSDVLNAIEALRREHHEKHDALAGKLDGIKSEMTDRLARVETQQSVLTRQVDRLDNRRP